MSAIQERLRRGERSALRYSFSTAEKEVDLEVVGRAALAGDAVALEELERSAWMLGCGVVSLVNLLDLELVVLGGRAFRSVGEIYKRGVEQVLARRLMGSPRRGTSVEFSEAGEDAGAVGAASLIFHTSFSPKLVGLEEEVV